MGIPSCPLPRMPQSWRSKKALCNLPWRQYGPYKLLLTFRCAFSGVCFVLFSLERALSPCRDLPSENGFFLLFFEKLWLLISLAFLFELGQVSVTYQKLLQYSNSLKQVLKARLLSSFSIPSFLWFCFFFLLLSQTWKGFLPELTTCLADLRYGICFWLP